MANISYDRWVAGAIEHFLDLVGPYMNELQLGEHLQSQEYDPNSFGAWGREVVPPVASRDSTETIG